MPTLLFPKVIHIEQAPVYTAPSCKKSMCHLPGLKTFTSTILRNNFSLQWIMVTRHPTQKRKVKAFAMGEAKIIIKCLRFWGISCVIYEYTGPKVGQKMSDVSLEIQTLLTKC